MHEQNPLKYSFALKLIAMMSGSGRYHCDPQTLAAGGLWT